MDEFERLESERAAREARDHAAAGRSGGPGAGRVWDAMMRYLGSEQYRDRRREDTTAQAPRQRTTGSSDEAGGAEGGR